MPYSWDVSLETGNQLIDGQHKQLINAVNSLLDACQKGRGQEEMVNTLEFLNAYIVKHFSDEEKLMVADDYPDYPCHRGYHEAFKVVVRDFTKDMLREGPTDEMVGKVKTIIVDWLLNHIKGDDFKLASYIALKEARGQTA
jgi:hemerythrin